MEDGTVAAVVAAKRKDAAARQAIARDRLGGLAGAQLRGDPGAYQVWLELSPPWNPNAFVAAAAARGVSVLPADFFMAEPGTPAPNAVRIALPDPPLETLTAAFDRLAAVLRDGPTKEKSHD
jgi:DNA-binding transcriptional MocR family regulator